MHFSILGNMTNIRIHIEKHSKKEISELDNLIENGEVKRNSIKPLIKDELDFEEKMINFYPESIALINNSNLKELKREEKVGAIIEELSKFSLTIVLAPFSLSKRDYVKLDAVFCNKKYEIESRCIGSIKIDFLDHEKSVKLVQEKLTDFDLRTENVSFETKNYKLKPTFKNLGVRIPVIHLLYNLQSKE